MLLESPWGTEKDSCSRGVPNVIIIAETSLRKARREVNRIYLRLYQKLKNSSALVNRERRSITIVTGVPRSGTSLMMQMLAAGGIPILSDGVRKPDESNPRGYFEFEPVKRLRSHNSWLTEANGRAIKIIHLLVRDLPVDGQYQYRVLLMKRSLEEVVASQHAMLARAGKAGGNEASLRRVFAAQLGDLEQWMARHSCFRCLAVEHQRVVSAPDSVAAEVADFVGGGLDVVAMARVVDPSLYRHRKS